MDSHNTSWDIRRFFSEVIGPDRSHFVKWLASKGLIPNTRVCECGHTMALAMPQKFIAYFICTRQQDHEDGRYRVSGRFDRTIFGDDDVSPYAVVFMMFCWANNFSALITCEGGKLHNISLTCQKVSNYFRIFHEVVNKQIMGAGCFDADTFFRPLGGENVPVELCMVTSQPQEKPDDNFCIFTIVEHTSNNYWMVSLPHNTVATEHLSHLVWRYVKPGSIIFTEHALDYSLSDTSKKYRFTNDFSTIPYSWNRIKNDSEYKGTTESEFEDFCYYLFLRTTVKKKTHAFDELVKYIAQQQKYETNKNLKFNIKSL